MKLKTLLIVVLGNASIYAHAEDWSSFYINKNACQHLYALGSNKKWVEQSDKTHITSKISSYYYCVYNNVPVHIMGADWSVDHPFLSTGSMLYAGSIPVTNMGDDYDDGTLWGNYTYDYWNLANAFNVNKTKSKNGFHLLIDKSSQDGSYAFEYDKKNKKGITINLYAGAVMPFGSEAHKAPQVHFQVVGDGSRSNKNSKPQQLPTP